MKKKILSFLFFIMLTSTVFGQSRLDSIVKKGVLRVGVTGDFNPMNFIDPKSKEYSGYDIEMFEQLAADMKVKVKYVKTDWKTLVQGIVSGKYDVSCSASVSPQRAIVAGYTDPYVEYNTVPVIQKKDANKYSDWGDLNKPNVRIATTLGTVFEQQAKAHFNKAKLVSVEPPARDFQNVLSGRADASITSNAEASKLIKTYPNLMILPVKQARNRRPGAMLVPQDDQVWINYLNHWIALKKTEGFFDELSKKWFGF